MARHVPVPTMAEPAPISPELQAELDRMKARIEANPEDGSLLCTQGELFRRAGRLREADVLLSETIRTVELDAATRSACLFNHAKVQLDQGMLDEALKLLTLAHEGANERRRPVIARRVAQLLEEMKDDVECREFNMTHELSDLKRIAPRAELVRECDDVFAVALQHSRSLGGDTRSEAAMSAMHDAIGRIRQEDCELMSEPEIRWLLSFRNHRPLFRCLAEAEPLCMRLERAELGRPDGSDVWSQDRGVRAYIDVEGDLVAGIRGQGVACNPGVSGMEVDLAGVDHIPFGRRTLILAHASASMSYSCDPDPEEAEGLTDEEIANVRCTDSAESDLLFTRGGRLLLAVARVSDPDGMLTVEWGSPLLPHSIRRVRVEGEHVIVHGRRLKMHAGALVPVTPEDLETAAAQPSDTPTMMADDPAPSTSMNAAAAPMSPVTMTPATMTPSAM